MRFPSLFLIAVSQNRDDSEIAFARFETCDLDGWASQESGVTSRPVRGPVIPFEPRCY
jgi:hypothetical protein